LIEKGSVWEFYAWKLPENKISINILGNTIEVCPQVYHVYESRVMEIYKTMTGGELPVLCKNSDPKYRL
jgi:hypothetical protein